MLKRRKDNGEPELVTIITDGGDFWEFAKVPETAFAIRGYIIDGHKCEFDEAHYERLSKIITYFASDFIKE